MFNPYNIIRDNDRTSFRTDEGILYECTFIDDEFIKSYCEVESNILHFDFFPVPRIDKNERRKDRRIHHTIIEIINSFFIKEPNGMILFYCDDSDKLGAARHRLFIKWMETFNINEPLKTLINVSIEDLGLYGSLLLDRNHHELDQVVQYLDGEIIQWVSEGKEVGASRTS